jgi:hypothetical protein
MALNRRNWRFFAEMTVGVGVISQHWCWERLDLQRNVVESGCGFSTVTAAVRDARRQGFSGEVEIGDPALLLRRSEDRRLLKSFL